MKILTTILLAGLFSCTQQKEVQITKDHVACTLEKVTRNMRGFKHVFVTYETKDTLYRLYERPLRVGQCYFLNGTVKYYAGRRK